MSNNRLMVIYERRRERGRWWCPRCNRQNNSLLDGGVCPRCGYDSGLPDFLQEVVV